MRRNAQKDITRCICDFNPGVGGFICCDKCSVWQHMSCMGVHPNKVPKTYECEMCNPRPVDKEAAIQLQLMLRAEESSDSESEKVTKKAKRGKRIRKPSACSVKPEEPIHFLEEGCSYKELKENMYSPAIQHRLEPRTEGQPSFASSPPGVMREQPQAGNGYNSLPGHPGMVQAVGKGTSKIIITKQIIRSGSFVIDLIGHFKRLSELFEEVGGKSALYKRPINYVLHYPLLDLCIDTREYGNMSRYIRRSCVPNSYTKSYLKEGKLRVGVYARDVIPTNTEITLPFDFQPEEYQFIQTCACITVGCRILKNNDKISKLLQRSESNNNDSILSDDDHSKKPKLSREEVKLQSYIQTIEKIEREEQRKRELSDNMKSPVRENNEPEDSSTPSKMGKRKRKGSGKKLRKGSSSSRENKSPQHFLFAPEITPPPIKQLYNIPPPPNPPYSVKDLKTSKMHVQCNGIGHDLYLRAMNTIPNSKHRKDFSLKNLRSITPIKVQKDGFVVPIAGSLLATKQPSQAMASYKTSKKRWLEQYILETKNKITDNLSPRQQQQQNLNYNDNKDNVSVSSGSNDNNLEQENTAEEALTEATKTLKLSDVEKHDKPSELPPLTSTLPSMEVETEATPATPLSATSEKKKKVSLADYKKRLQSRGSKTRDSVTSDISIESKSDKENSPRLKPVFEPISPEDADRFLQSSSLLEEFSKPSLSETLSTESIHPHKIRRLDGSKNSDVFGFSKSLSTLSSPVSINSPQITEHKVAVTPPHTVCNGVNHSNSIGSSPPTTITDDTFTKIKEILTRNNVPSSSNITTTVMKNNRSIYDNSYTLHSENSYNTQDPKRLKSSISNNDYKK